MKQGLFALVCLSLLMLVPACHRRDNNGRDGEGKMKQQKTQTRNKTEKTYSRKSKDGGVVEETTTTKSEVKQQRPQSGK